MKTNLFAHKDCYSFNKVKCFQFLLSNTYNNSIQTICLQTLKWLQVLLFDTNYSIQYYTSECTQPNGS